ncbi:hypothetical protein [Nocardia suismassiliense]|uniref:hypothetical protein n=1 Tax=Nocardia suismassiliense TaxID=2077092 RepID=UPI0018FE9FF5|nr:hypothetical protein [Nocardia suismassiliense]
MNSKMIRPLAVAMFALSAVALSAGPASAGSGSSSGSVELCLPIPLGSAENTLCLPLGG